MRRFIIEREIAGVGQWDSCELANVERTSTAVLDGLGPELRWQYSCVVIDKTYRVDLAEDEQSIRLHSEKTGFPASCIAEIRGMIDPATATG